MLISKAAIFSENRLYRYQLSRIWAANRSLICFIGLNPSTANEQIDDATIRRCIHFASNWKYGGILMVNLFALRSKDPKILIKSKSTNPIGDLNNFHIINSIKVSKTVVACWGNNGTFLNRDKQINDLFKIKKISNIYCLGYTVNHAPKHPLYLKRNTKLIPYKF